MTIDMQIHQRLITLFESALEIQQTQKIVTSWQQNQITTQRSVSTLPCRRTRPHQQSPRLKCKSKHISGLNDYPLLKNHAKTENPKIRSQKIKVTKNNRRVEITRIPEQHSSDKIESKSLV